MPRATTRNASKRPAHGQTTARKPGASRRAAAGRPTASTAEADAMLSEAVQASQSEQLGLMIAEAAYFKAEKRGFAGGSEELDWLEAEKEVLAALTK